MRLAHSVKHRSGAMLGCDLKLTADMVSYQFPEKGIAFICHYIIKAYSRTDKYIFNFRNGPDRT